MGTSPRLLDARPALASAIPVPRAWFGFGIFLLQVAMLWWRYRPEFGDLGIIASQGAAILAAGDPMESPLWAVGSSAAVFGHLLMEVLRTPVLVNVALLALNLAGVAMFMRVYLGVRDNRVVWLVLCIVPMTMPFRVGFADVQVAGVLLLLVSSARYLRARGSGPAAAALAGLLSSVALDLKPAMALAFVLVNLVTFGWRYLAWVSGAWLVTHALINLRLGQSFEPLWLERLGERAVEALQPGPELSPWQILYGLGLSPGWGRLLEALVLGLALLAVAVVTRRHGAQRGALVASMVPLLIGYQHLYDPIALAAAAVLLAGASGSMPAWLLLGFVLLPGTTPSVVTLGVAAATAAVVAWMLTHRGTVRARARNWAWLLLPIAGHAALAWRSTSVLDVMPLFLAATLGVALLSIVGAPRVLGKWPALHAARA